MPDQQTRPLEAFPARTVERLRYGDTDRQGHVNNAIYATLFESGRVAFLFDPEAPLAPPGTQFVIVTLTIEFRRELLWPGDVAIGTGVTHIGGKSVGVEQALYRDGEIAASAESVLAIMDDRTRRAIAIPAETRTALQRWRLAT
jgi:acyl-CoA thioester hydrolase